jgi:outer membrane protein OmpA-like peptidoglycan-associated protein
MKIGKIGLIIALFVSVVFMQSGCASSNKVKGGAIGAGAGGAVGAIIGKQYGNTAAGAILGAAVGGTAGALIGRNMDKQAAEIEKNVKDAKVERVGEGIKITFESGILFKTDSSTLQPKAKENVEKLSETLKKNPDTNILIEGHTDSDGSEEYNMKLSERRAQAVKDYLKSLGVSSSRLTTKGYGETQPVADNSTAEGKQANRRVEIAVMANENMKKAAEEGNLK